MVCSSNVAEFTLWLASRLEVAVDIETYGEGKKGGLNHIHGSIRLIQFADKLAIWIIEQSNFDLAKEAITKLLKNSSQRKIGHNFMFDLRFLRKEFDVLARNCADTMLGSRCLLGDMGAAQITSHSLQQACENFLGIDVDKSEQKSDWDGELTSEQLDYAARDPWLTFCLYKRLEAVTKDPSLLLLPFPKMLAWEAWEVENHFIFAAQQMEATGYKIDMQRLAETKAKYQNVLDQLLAKWEAPCEPTQKEKLRQFLNTKYNLSLKSLSKATAAKHLNIPEIKLMQQICSCDAIITCLKNIETQISINNGRVKPVFKILSGTGRTSSGATKIEQCLINLQSLTTRVNPVLKEFKLPSVKALFFTDLIIDLPASHGRIASEESNDENHLKGYLDKSIDMHCITAAAVAKAVFPGMNYTAEWIQANKDNDPIAKGLRDTAKNTYYAWLNGAGVARIKEQISSNLQIDADPAMCKAALDGLQSVFEKTTDYAKSKLLELETNQFVVNGFVCGWYQFGSTYLCWKLGAVGGDLKVPATKAFAGIWSRLESILMKRSCARIAEKFADVPEWNAKLQNFIHDEVNCEIGNLDAAKFAHSVIQEEFGKVCPRTVAGFDSFEKCVTWKKPVLDANGKPLKDANDKVITTTEKITNWSQK
jgi:DNA polymerase III epsilon subunit-like protein